MELATVVLEYVRRLTSDVYSPRALIPLVCVLLAIYLIVATVALFVQSVLFG